MNRTRLSGFCAPGADPCLVCSHSEGKKRTSVLSYSQTVTSSSASLSSPTEPREYLYMCLCVDMVLAREGQGYFVAGTDTAFFRAPPPLGPQTVGVHIQNC